MIPINRPRMKAGEVWASTDERDKRRYRILEVKEYPYGSFRCRFIEETNPADKQYVDLWYPCSGLLSWWRKISEAD